MATTNSFDWETPDDTDLVKDGAAAIRTLGQSIDTSMTDLLGGTTGQVLSKASDTDMDFTWAAPTTGDITGVSVTSPITGGGTSGDVTIGIAASAVVPSQTGNAGKYLTTDGTDSSWGTISAGGMTLLNAGGTSLTGSEVSITSIPGTYNELRVYCVGFQPATDGRYIWMRFNGDSTANRHSYETANNVPSKTFGETFVKFSDATDNGSTTNLSTATIPAYANTTSWKTADLFTVTPDQSTPANWVGLRMFGVYNQTSAITSLTFGASSGSTFTSGTIYVYGVK